MTDRAGLLDDSEVDSEIAPTDWERTGSEIVTTRTFDDFAGSLSFVNAVGQLAEEVDHHPDIDIRWNKVTLRLSTHSAGGITRRDLSLARRIDSIGT